MKTRAVSFLALILLFGLLPGCQRVNKAARRFFYDPSKANPAEVSLNGAGIDSGDAGVRFLVIGHAYGSTSVDDHLPDPAFLASLPALKELDLDLLVSLGDIVQHSIPEDFDNLESSLLGQVAFPVFNTPGNHDVVDRGEYASRYGQTYFSFRAGPAQMIFLDTERETCAIDAEQQKMLQKALRRAERDSQVKRIFIFMHKTLFFDNQRLAELNQPVGLPNVMDCFASENFAGLLKADILPAAQKKPVVIFGGDVGAWGNLTPYYEARPADHLTLITTGLGDNPDNAGILVTLAGEDADMEVYSFTGRPVQPLDTYTPDYWIDKALNK